MFDRKVVGLMPKYYLLAEDTSQISILFEILLNKFSSYQYKMTQDNSLNVNLSNSQLNKFKSAVKDKTEVVLRLSPNMIGDNETNFPHQLLLTNRQVANIRKAFSNNSSIDI